MSISALSIQFLFASAQSFYPTSLPWVLQLYYSRKPPPSSLRLKDMCPLTLFLLHITLVINGSFSYHTNFKNILLISGTIIMGFNWNSIESVCENLNLKNTVFFTIHTQYISPHLHLHWSSPSIVLFSIEMSQILLDLYPRISFYFVLFFPTFESQVYVLAVAK